MTLYIMDALKWMLGGVLLIGIVMAIKMTEDKILETLENEDDDI